MEEKKCDLSGEKICCKESPDCSHTCCYPKDD